MTKFERITTIMLAGVALPLLAGCGASEIASTGAGTVNITPTPTPTPAPTPTPTPQSTAAGGCPTISNGPGQLTDDGIISGPTGTYRVCTLPAFFTRNTTLPRTTGVLYRINGRVNVGCDSGFTTATVAAPSTGETPGCNASAGASDFLFGSGLDANKVTRETNVTLTIEPGVVLYGSGSSFLAVNRGNKLVAEGTASRPIVFTSQDNVLGLETDSTIGHWGGIILMGRARVTDCTAGGTTAGNTCERDTEGVAAKTAVFGGLNDADNSGSLKFVQIRYSGFILSNGIELQSLTPSGVGSGTQFDSVQSHNSSDDGMEFFGGTVRFKHYVATGADDDSLDADTGVQGSFQHVLIVQRASAGDAMFEIDSNGNTGDTPRSALHIANVTAIQTGTQTNAANPDLAAMLLRGNSDTTFVNTLIVTPNNECIQMNGSGGTPATLVARSMLMQCAATKYLGSDSLGANGNPLGGSITAAQVATLFGSGSNGNSDAFTATLTSVFVNGTAETGATATDPKTVFTGADQAFFDATNFVGAVRSTDTWHQGWTCNSSYAPFDNVSVSARSCTSIPVI